MQISVIIPIFNRANIIKKAVTSALEQTYPPYEVIVVDDGSTDDPAGGLSTIDDERMMIVRQDNHGVSAARNLGITKSKGEWLAFLDSDDWWLSERLEKQVEFHQQNPDILISQTDEMWIRNGRRINQRNYHLKPQGDIFELSLARCLISPSAVMIKKELFDEVGIFDESLPVCEDYDLWLRITSRFSIGLIPEKLVVKTGGHADQLSRKHWGMDRFRVTSLHNLINSGCLNDIQKKAATGVLIEKLTILLSGAQKRNKSEDCRQYEMLLKKYSQFLLNIQNCHPEEQGDEGPHSVLMNLDSSASPQNDNISMINFKHHLSNYKRQLP